MNIQQALRVTPQSLQAATWPSLKLDSEFDIKYVKPQPPGIQNLGMFFHPIEWFGWGAVLVPVSLLRFLDP